jgi:hypothetical protein
MEMASPLAIAARQLERALGGATIDTQPLLEEYEGQLTVASIALVV